MCSKMRFKDQLISSNMYFKGFVLQKFVANLTRDHGTFVMLLVVVVRKLIQLGELFYYYGKKAHLVGRAFH